MVVVVAVKPARVVVVADEDAKQILLVLALQSVALVVAVSDLVHALSTAEHIAHRVEHRVVEDGINHALIPQHVVSVSVKHFSDHVASCVVVELSPEVLGYVALSVETESIESILLLQPAGPVVELIPDVVVALVEVSQAGEPALLYGVLVTEVDVAVWVVVVS